MSMVQIKDVRNYFMENNAHSFLITSRKGKKILKQDQNA